MKINKLMIKKLEPCADGYSWYLKNGTEDLLETLLKVNAHRPDYARWLFTRLMTVKQRREIAIFAAKLVLPIFEKRFPKDKRPREAIEAAVKVLKHDTEENRNAAYAAAYAADAAANAADAAANAAANAAAYAAYAAYAAAKKECADIVRAFYPSAPKLTLATKKKRKKKEVEG